MPHPNIRLLSLPIVALCGLLLIALRLDAKWTGGLGYVTPCPAQLRSDETVSVRRGDSMRTESSTRAIYVTCDDTTYVLDERTEAKLAMYKHLAPTQIELLQGRLLVHGQADIKTRDVLVHVTGSCEIVHYSWRDEVDITPLTENGCSISEHTPSLRTTARFNTYTGILLSLDVFRAEQSSAAPFYLWATEQGVF